MSQPCLPGGLGNSGQHDYGDDDHDDHGDDHDHDHEDDDFTITLQACRGHCGYPVTHFWRHVGEIAIFFQVASNFLSGNFPFSFIP